MTAVSQPTPEQIIARHGYFQAGYECLCNTEWNSASIDRDEWAAHVLAALRDAGYATVKLPEPCPDVDTDYYRAPEGWMVETPDHMPGRVAFDAPGDSLTAADARLLAAALLAAADACDHLSPTPEPASRLQT